MPRALKTTLRNGAILGQWTVLDATVDPNGYVACRCSCGTERSVLAANLTNGHSKSCGCTRMPAMHAASTLHGHAAEATYEYLFWTEAKKLCSRNSRDSYGYYGGRGLKMHPTWAAEFARFLADVGERPGSGLVLGRRNKKKGFVPGNVAWMDSRQRQLGKKDKRLVTINGVTKQLQQWADEYGLKKNTLHWRLQHWPEERWLEKPNDIAPPNLS